MKNVSSLALFKGSASEGGLRVPLIISGSAGIQEGVTTDAFAFVTDLAPTPLELAGVSALGESYSGKDVHPINGKSMLGFLRGDRDHVHGPGEAVVYGMLEKAFMVYLVVSNRGEDLAGGFMVPAGMDAILTVWSILYLATRRRD